jgi:hypothetical protein
MKRKTTVNSHSRKGTKGVVRHTRIVTTPIKKIVPSSTDDEIIDITEKRLRDAEAFARDEINLEHEWMDLEAQRLKLQKQGLKIPKKLLKEQEKIQKRIFRLSKSRMKRRSLIRETTKVINVKKRRKLIRRELKHRGITKIIS